MLSYPTTCNTLWEDTSHPTYACFSTHQLEQADFPPKCMLLNTPTRAGWLGWRGAHSQRPPPISHSPTSWWQCWQPQSCISGAFQQATHLPGTRHMHKQLVTTKHTKHLKLVAQSLHSVCPNIDNTIHGKLTEQTNTHTHTQPEPFVYNHLECFPQCRCSHHSEKESKHVPLHAYSHHPERSDTQTHTGMNTYICANAWRKTTCTQHQLHMSSLKLQIRPSGKPMQFCQAALQTTGQTSSSCKGPTDR